MTQVKLDAELRSKLGGFRDSIELIDDTGMVVGKVVRIVGANGVRPWEPPLSEDEISRTPQRTYSSEEVRAGLRDR